MNTRYILMLTACFLVTTSYGMELQHGRTSRDDSRTYETAHVRRVSFGRRCLEHAAVGFLAGFTVATLPIEDVTTKTIINETAAFGPSIAYQYVRGFNDLGFRGPWSSFNPLRTSLALSAGAAGFVVGAGTAVLCGYPGLNPALQESTER